MEVRVFSTAPDCSDGIVATRVGYFYTSAVIILAGSACMKATMSSDTRKLDPPRAARRDIGSMPELPLMTSRPSTFLARRPAGISRVIAWTAVTRPLELLSVWMLCAAFGTRRGAARL